MYAETSLDLDLDLDPDLGRSSPPGGRVVLGGRRYRRGAAIRAIGSAIGGGKASGTGVRAELKHEAGVEDALGPV